MGDTSFDTGVAARIFIGEKRKRDDEPDGQYLTRIILRVVLLTIDYPTCSWSLETKRDGVPPHRHRRQIRIGLKFPGVGFRLSILTVFCIFELSILDV